MANLRETDRRTLVQPCQDECSQVHFTADCQPAVQAVDALLMPDAHTACLFTTVTAQDGLITLLQEDRERPYKTMEQRLAAYRQECEVRLQEEVQRQVNVTLLTLSRRIELQPCTYS